MGEYDVQQVCLNGHQITDSYIRFPENRKKFCDKCGAPTISECPNCKCPIRGHRSAPGVITFGSAIVPSNCQNCGKPFPWTERKIDKKEEGVSQKEIKLTTFPKYVNPVRIEELKAVSGRVFDLTKLVKLCEELNICCQADCHFAMIMLTRSILDHVPPIFGCNTFSEVANNYGGSKSFKESMIHLENSSRTIADQHLHCRIRKSEILATITQVDFSNDLDVLFSEIIRIFK